MVEIEADPWHISALEYPVKGTFPEKMSFLIGYAILAPSGHNTQPWLYHIDEDSIRLYADRSRALPIVDPKDREMTISCGASLFFLRLAMRYFGLNEETALLPDPSHPDLLAVVRPGAKREPTPAETELFESITHRHTNRQPFEARAIESGLLRLLSKEAAMEGVILDTMAEPDKKEAIARLVAEGDRRQLGNVDFRKELAAWVHRRQSPTHDGIPGYALGLNETFDFMTPVAAMLIRRFDMGKAQAARDHELAAGSPALAVLSSIDDSPESWLRVGQALARLLLRATAEGLSASFLNQPIEEPLLRMQLRDELLIDGLPQLVLRLGYGPPAAAPTPRRTVIEVLE